jgi:dUTP pyrophosphatase
MAKARRGYLGAQGEWRKPERVTWVMKIKIKRFDTSLPLPEYKTKGAAAFDLYARENTIIPPQKTKLVPLNIALLLPKDHFALMSARSSLHKKSLIMANGIGIGDEDYCGNDDEYRAALFNLSDREVLVEKGERIVQMIILPVEKAQLIETENLSGKNRGGFGSTGKR